MRELEHIALAALILVILLAACVGLARFYAMMFFGRRE